MFERLGLGGRGAWQGCVVDPPIANERGAVPTWLPPFPRGKVTHPNRARSDVVPHSGNSPEYRTQFENMAASPPTRQGTAGENARDPKPYADPAEERAEASEAMSFASFLEKMKGPKATGLVRSIRTFIRTFESQQPHASGSRSRAAVNTTAVQDRNGELVRSFLADMETLIAGHALFGGSVGLDDRERACAVEEGAEGLEKYIMSKLYALTFQVASDEVDKDDRCHRLCKALEFLDVNTVIGSRGGDDDASGSGSGNESGDGSGDGSGNRGGECGDAEEPKLDDYCVAILDEHIEQAKEHLRSMDKYKAPMDKLVCLMNVQATLEDGIRRVNASDTSLSFGGADAFFPLLVLVVVRAVPRALSSNIEYVRRFRSPSRLGGQCDFMLSCLESVALYLETVDWKDLRIDREAWVCRLREAGLPEAAALDGCHFGSDPALDAQVGSVNRLNGTNDAVGEHVAGRVEPDPPMPGSALADETPGTQADLVEALIEEGTPLVLHEESEGRLVEKYPWIYSDAGDVKDAQIVDQLLSAYRDVVVKHEALKLAIGNGSELLRPTARSNCRDCTGSRTEASANGGLVAPATAGTQLVTDFVQRVSMLSSGWTRKGDAGSRVIQQQQGTASAPYLLSSLFGGTKSAAPPMLSPVTASIGGVTHTDSNVRTDENNARGEGAEIDAADVGISAGGSSRGTNGGDDPASFDAATAYVESTAAADKAVQLPASVLLELYALFKQATVGPYTTQELTRPGVFDPKGRAKHDAWSKLGDLPSSEARKRYVHTVTQYHPKWREQLAANRPKSVVGPVFSVPKGDADHGDGEEFPRIIQLVQEGNVAPVEALLLEEPAVMHQRDSEGCTCLHWAADKGNVQVVELLLSHGADKDAADVDGLKPVDYALLRDEQDGHRSRIVELLQ